MTTENALLASRYVDGDMDAAERQEFELLLQSDAALRDYTTTYRQANAALSRSLKEDAGAEKLKQTLQQLGKVHFTPGVREAKIVSMKPYIRWLSGVAAVLLIGILVFVPWRKDLYEEYSTTGDMQVAERGEGAQTTLEKAADLFNKKDFKHAEVLLASEYKLRPENSLAAYYYGVVLIENEKEADARVVLENVFAGQSVFKYDAAYYIALSFVKEKNNAQAKIWLERIPEGTSNYQKAKELGEKL